MTVISNERRRINLLKGLLVPATIGVFDDKYIVADPVVEEESMCAITSIVTDGKDRIYGVIKYSGRGVDQDAQRKVMQRAKLRTSELLVQLEKINTGNRWKE